MAGKAYVLIETESGKTRDIANVVAGIKGVKQADVVTGPYDIIAHVEGADLEAIGEIVTNQLQSVPGVIRTLTCLAIPSQKPKPARKKQ